MAKKKEVKKKSSSKKSSSKNFKSFKSINLSKTNFWTITSIVLAVLLIATLLSGNSGGSSMNAEEVGKKIVDFANAQGANAELVSVTDEGALYSVILSIQGQEVPVYATKDGKSLITNPIPLDGAKSNSAPSNSEPSNSAPSNNIPKSDRPKVELFWMTHCPYGTQMTKGMLPVWNLLKDDMDFEIKHVYYAMHGEVEVMEQLNQYCIQKEEPEKFRGYLTCFLEKGDGAGCITKTGIDTSKLSSCTKEADTKFEVTANLKDQSKWLSGRFPLFNTYKEDNEKYNVGGSPTLVINGVTVNTARDSASLLKTICGAFNTQPKYCETKLSSGTPSPGFGFSETTVQNQAAAAAACGGA